MVSYVIKLDDGKLGEGEGDDSDPRFFNLKSNAI
jgi:hypothetical protein